MAATLAQKLWKAHAISRLGGRDLLYVDLHLIHELNAQSFTRLRERGLGVARPDLTVGTMDHNVPTADRHLPLADPLAARQLQAIVDDCAEFGIRLFGMGTDRQGIVHVIGPELGLTQPGMLIACGDSHTATHGALGALALGIGMSQVEQVLANQCLLLAPSKDMLVKVEGALGFGITPKDVALHVVRTLGFSGAAGHIVEFSGSVIDAMSIEGRMTVCNMAAEAGARAAVIAPDDTTLEYLSGRSYAPSGEQWRAAVRYWETLHSDGEEFFDVVVTIDASEIEPTVTWGTTPAMSVSVTAVVPVSTDDQSARALEYMGLSGGEAIRDLQVDRVFIGSCTNSRIEDLRAAAKVARGRSVAAGVRALVVPGSMTVRRQAEAEGLDRAFTEAGFEWREPGCSMCLGMNADILGPGERCASTSNRNFEGRQGIGGRTHLVSPAMAAAAAVFGHFVDIREVS